MVLPYGLFFMQIKMKKFICRNKYLAVTALTAFTMLTSCSDDDLYDRDLSDDPHISFQLRTVSFASRSGANQGAGEAIRAQSEDSILYLNPVITSGINIEAESRSASRSSSVTSSSIDDFGVFAMTASGETYMDNVIVTRGNNWAPEEEYLWPGDGNLSFTAYSPFGMTVVTTPEGNRAIDFAVDPDVAKQRDLLLATPVKASASPCQLDFNHALTAIRFVAGAEMTPCEVKSIEIAGVPSAGRVDIENATWQNVSGDATYTVAPKNSKLTAAAGSQFVAPSTPITSDDETLLLIPGTLPQGATITLTLSINGVDKEFVASVGGQKWPQGATVTYRLSAKPESNRLILDVAGNFRTEYPGQTVPFYVRSCYVTEAGDTVPVAWRAEFVDDSGNPIQQPEWMKEFPLSGDGLDYTRAVTKMQRLTFTRLSEQSQILQNTPNINATSGQTIYNLSNPTGASTVENTANCYIVNAPGKYSIPLVYGNAIKNGVDNKAAYTSSSHNANALKSFVNHLDKAITAPYIADNQGCTPSDAILVWEGRLDLIRNVNLDSEQMLSFEVPEESIRQGNAIIAVRDKDKNIMWSWNIWVTDYVPDTDLADLTYNGTTLQYYTRNIGRIMGGDVTVFPHCRTAVKFTQTGTIPEGLEPLTTTIDFNQTGITTTTSDCYNFYQWGRKDPMKSETNEWFDAEHYKIDQFRTLQIESVATEANYIEQYILHPDIFYTGRHGIDNPTKYDYTNLWNSSLSTADNVKTIYDPCPVGAKVPLGNDLLHILQSATPEYGAAINGSHSMGLYFTLASGTKIFFPMLGYRSASTGNDREGYGTNGSMWLAQTSGGANAKTEARCIIMTAGLDGTGPTAAGQGNSKGFGFGIRPVKE